MKKSLLIFLLLFITQLCLVKATVLINEFVVDPQTDWNNNSAISDGSDEWIELFNDGTSAVNLSGWEILFVDTSNETQILNVTISPNGHFVILNPPGSQNNDGQLILKNSLGEIADKVTYGNWNDGNVSDNAPTGNANNQTDECLARFPDGADSNVDSTDFVKTACTYGASNSGASEPSSNQQGLNVTISGVVVFGVFPRSLEFGLVQPGSINNLALNGPIIFDVNGSTTSVNVEITNVTGFPFENGLKIDGAQALGASWFFNCVMTSQGCAFSAQNAVPTLDIPNEAPAGNNQGTITYTVSGNF